MSEETFLYIYVLGYFISVYLICGMSFAEMDNLYPNPHWQQHMSFALPWAIGGSLMWPAVLPIVWMSTGFGRYGFYFKPRKRKT